MTPEWQHFANADLSLSEKTERKSEDAAAAAADEKEFVAPK